MSIQNVLTRMHIVLLIFASFLGIFKGTMSQKPNVFNYNDFRAYLKDFYAYKHQRNKKFSKAFICKELGLPNSRSYFQDVLNGKFISQLKVPLFIKVFDLDRDEAQFFRVLVNYNQAVDDPEEREFLFEQLISLNQTPKAIISAKEYAYYKDWYNSVVRAVLNIVDFKKDGNYLKFARQIFPPLTETQARGSVNLLLDLELIAENDHGFLKPTEKVISTGAYAKDEVIKQHQLKSFDIAREAILKNQKQPQRVITKTISVSEEGYNRVLKNIEKCSSEINSIVHKDEAPADRVYQLDIILFPHSNKGKI
jgi:uncharacterized protein (TIGR02147 family)